MQIAQFDSNFSLQKDTHLKLVVSVGNKKQSGKNLLKFVNLINELDLGPLEIVTTGSLYTHYFGEEKANELVTQWHSKNKKYLSRLKKGYKITTLKELIADEQAITFNRVNLLYKNDPIFKDKIDKLATEYAYIKGWDAARDYAIDDVVAALLIKGPITYPFPELNPAIVYALKNFSRSLEYIPYGFKSASDTIKPGKLEHPKKEQLVETKEIKEIIGSEAAELCVLFSMGLRKLGFFSKEKQSDLFKKFLISSGSKNIFLADKKVENFIVPSAINNMEITSGTSYQPH